jgi:NADH:ubiquinone oxidoreductase subunit 4 (subunit M)
MICFGLYMQNSVIVLLASINMITGAAYTLWALNRVVFGNVKTIYIHSFGDLTRLEFYTFFLLFVIMLFMGLKPNFFLTLFHGLSHFLALTI